MPGVFQAVTDAAPILVTGGSGQLATALPRAAVARGSGAPRRPPGIRLRQPSEHRRTLFARSARRSSSTPPLSRPSTRRKTEAEAAYRANRDGPAGLARLCAKAGVPLIHISTDYVFDGNKGAPYREDDRTNPQGVYGASKLAGEQAVLPPVRLPSSCAPPGSMPRRGRTSCAPCSARAETRDRLRVVADQQGCPTAAADLALAILAILPQIADARGQMPRACSMLAGTGATTWHGFATAVFESAARYGIEPPAIEAIATADWPTPAKRPANSRLDCSLAVERFGVALPAWRPSLDRVINSIFSVGA